MKLPILLILTLTTTAAGALSLDDFQGDWKRFGVRCEADMEVVYLNNPITLKITGDTFVAASEWPDLGTTTTSGQIITAQDPIKDDRLKIQFVNISHRDIVTENNTDQDFLLSKVGLKTLTFRIRHVGNSDVLILGGDDPKQMANGCSSSTEYLYRRVQREQATNQSAN